MDHPHLQEQEILQLLNTRDKLLNLVISNLPVILFMIDQQGIIRLSVGKGQHKLSILGPETVNQSIQNAFRTSPEIISCIERAMQGESFSSGYSDGGISALIHYSPLRDSSARSIGVIGVSVDITAQKQVEDALVKSEARFRTLIERAAVGIVLKSIEGQVYSINPYFLNMLGYQAEEISKYSYIDITHPLDQPISQRVFKELVSGQRNSYSIEKRYLRKDGSYCWGRVTASLMVADNKPQYVIAMIENISQQKEMEAELLEVQRRLMHGREMERLQLAQELHNGPLQEILGASYQLRALENEPDAGYNVNQLHAIQEILDRMADTLRSIALELRPPSLAPFGLETAIRSHAKELQEQHPELKIVLRLAQDRQSLTNEVRISLFRIYQESVKNILSHSGAETIWVRFLLDDDFAVIEIQDDGRGFELPHRWVELVRQGHLGLVGAIERAEAVGGRLDIESTPNKGTLIRAVIPLNGSRA